MWGECQELENIPETKCKNSIRELIDEFEGQYKRESEN